MSLRNIDLKRIKHRYIPKFFVYLFLTIGGLIFTFPFYLMVSGSFMTEKQIFSKPPEYIPRPFFVDSILQALKFLGWRSYLNIFIITVAVTLGVCILASMLGFAFAKLKLPGKNILFYIIIAAVFVPWQIAIVPRFVLVAKMGMLDSFQGAIIPLLANIIMPTYFFRNYFSTIPDDLFDAAKIDGCSTASTFIRIILPLSKPAFSTIAALVSLFTWNNYMWMLIVLQSGKMQVLTTKIAGLSNPESYASTSFMLSSAFLATLPLLIMYIFAQKWFVQGIGTQGLKY